MKKKKLNSNVFINLVCLFVYFKKVFFSSYYYSGLFEDFLNVYFPRFNYFYFKDFLIWWIFKNDEEVKKKKNFRFLWRYTDTGTIFIFSLLRIQIWVSKFSSPDPDQYHINSDLKHRTLFIIFVQKLLRICLLFTTQ